MDVATSVRGRRERLVGPVHFEGRLEEPNAEFCNSQIMTKLVHAGPGPEKTWFSHGHIVGNCSYFKFEMVAPRLKFKLSHWHTSPTRNDYDKVQLERNKEVCFLPLKAAPLCPIGLSSPRAEPQHAAIKAQRLCPMFLGEDEIWLRFDSCDPDRYSHLVGPSGVIGNG